ncbi:hypothetical protein [Kineococcus sp. G2]|uniref:hypothetical protein n=1 Tax=Kineococcus sp. G2 TaxID=3127484 RepID=UPI00301E59EF
MDALAVRFDTACARRADPARPELHAAALAAACRDVLNDDLDDGTATAAAVDPCTGLGVDGVSISVADQDPWRLPVGASDPAAAAAERWQFVSGQGPGAVAWSTGRPVVADQTRLRRAWPVLHDLLHRHTPYRSTIAVPVPRLPAGQPGSPAQGVLELHFHRERPLPPPGGGGAGLVRARAVAALVGARLWGVEGSGATSHGSGAPTAASGEPAGCRPDPGRPPGGQPTWMDAPGARERQCVWMVISMARQVLRTADADALALLRATAYSRDRTLEDLAGDVVEGRLPLRALHVPLPD